MGVSILTLDIVRPESYVYVCDVTILQHVQFNLRGFIHGGISSYNLSSSFGPQRPQEGPPGASKLLFLKY